MKFAVQVVLEISGLNFHGNFCRSFIKRRLFDATSAKNTRQILKNTRQILKIRQNVGGEVIQEDKMADDELEAIRAKRMAELQQQMVRMTLNGFEANVLL